MDRLQSQSGHFGEEKNLLPLLGIEPPDCPADSPNWLHYPSSKPGIYLSVIKFPCCPEMIHFSTMFIRDCQWTHQTFNPAHIFTLSFSIINLYSVLPFMPRCHLRFSDQNFVCTSYFCQVLKCVLEAVMAPYNKVHTDMQKMSEQLHITPFFTKPSLSTMFSVLFDDLGNFSQEHRHHSS